MACTMQTRVQCNSKPAIAATAALRPSRVALGAAPKLPSRVSRRSMLAVRAEEGFGGEKGDSSDTLQGIKIPDNKQQDSFTKIEGSARADNPSDGGPPMSQRQGANDKQFVQADGAAEKNLLGTEVALSDAMRFKGAAPEIINSRLAMLGFIAALGAELASGKTIFEQTAVAPNAVITTFVVFAIATLVPILRGVPRKDAKAFGGLSAFTAKAELFNGRLAIMGFPCLLIQEYIMKQPTFPHIF